MYGYNFYSNLFDSIVNNNPDYTPKDDSSTKKLMSYYSEKFKPFLESMVDELEFSMGHLIKLLSESKDERHKFVLELIKKDFKKDIVAEKTIEELFKPT